MSNYLDYKDIFNVNLYIDEFSYSPLDPKYSRRLSVR